MNAGSKLIFRFARWIAGPQRAEWIDAMASEAASICGGSTTWALGSLWAAINDRFFRARRLLVAILLLPIGANVLSFALFYPMAWLFREGWIPGWVFVGSGLLSPLPFAFILGRISRGFSAYFAAFLSCVLGVFLPLIIFWAKFGKSPFSWFGDDTTWYMMTPAAGLTSAFLIWVVGVWLGSRSRYAAA